MPYKNTINQTKYYIFPLNYQQQEKAILNFKFEYSDESF